MMEEVKYSLNSLQMMEEVKYNPNSLQMMMRKVQQEV